MKTLLTKQQIKKQIEILGKEISDYYKNDSFICLVVLKGSFIFASDLVREISSTNCTMDFIRLSSYRGKQSSGNVKMLMGELEKYKDKNLLVIEDIVDTGLTLSFFLEKLKEVKVKSVKVCSLLEKKEINQGKVKIDFLGFDIPNKFVIGYGLDFDEKYRNLPEIVIFDED